MDIIKEIERIDKLRSIINAIQHFDAKIKMNKSTLRQINGNFPVLINKINNDIDTYERVIIKLQLKFQKLFKNDYLTDVQKEHLLWEEHYRIINN